MRKKKKKAENSERWLLTYSDLITLLVAVFVVMFAMSNVNQQKYEQLSASLGKAFGKKNSIIQGTDGINPGSKGILDGGSDATKAPEENTETVNPSPTSTPKKYSDGKTTSITNEEEMKKIKEKIDKVLEEYGLGDSMHSMLEKRGLTISFPDSAFFDSGDDTLKEQMKHGLNKISGQLRLITNSIIVEGHTDNKPISTSQFSSNWQLSASRAANVVQYLVEKGGIKGSRLAAIGYGENQPVASNKTEQGRSQNRRINMIILYNNK